MDSLDEFQFWCAEYRDNPRMGADEADRLLKSMCAGGNPEAQRYARSLKSSNPEFEKDCPETPYFHLVEIQTEDGSIELSPDDFEGNDWGAIIGAIEPEAVGLASGTEFEDIGPDGYSLDWPTISVIVKSERNWCCESCLYSGIFPSLLAVHHVNQNKTDNSSANLQVLCSVCHGIRHNIAPLWPNGASETQKQELLKYHTRVRAKRQN